MKEMVMIMENLENRWVMFAKSLGAETKVAESTYDVLSAGYTQSSRHYHTLGHIQACLSIMDQHVPKDEWTNHVEMAVWWHDFVYVPGRPDNEWESTLAMHKHGRAMKLHELFIGQVAEMIPVTAHNVSLEGKPDRFKYLIDVDLSILGASEDIFDTYEDEIRKEYIFAPETVYRQRRAQILQTFLDRPFIYETELFRGHYEGLARENLKRSLKKLVT
jgi:predicted metal-dependent HD superfamily phosphohydrolase